MRQAGRCLGLLLVAVCLGCTSGCFGFTQNPSYFPYWLPTGDLIRTHAKPISPGYYANFDPHAVDLIVEPVTMTSQVGSQVVILATVRDEKGEPRRSRRVEWKATNGNIIEVDESGVFPGRGGIEGNTAFSFTSYHEHRLTRGNATKADDIMIRPGQTWCVVSSPVEGDTHVQVVAPAIFNWEKRMKTTVIRWVDATWEFPPRAVAKFGTEHEFVTRISRYSTREPLAKYRVRYKILDGPPAVFMPSQAQEQVVVTDLAGLGKVNIRQVGVTSGVNRVSVEIIRPPDPTTPSGSGVSIVTGETSVEWLAPNVKLSYVGPPSAVVEQNVSYTVSAKNEGRIESQGVLFKLPIPDGMEFVSSNPPPLQEPRGGVLEYPFAPVAVGQTHAVQATFRAKRAGPVKAVALMETAEKQTEQAEVNTLITTPQLKVEINAPKTGIVDVPINYSIRLTNPGTGDLDAVQMIVTFAPGLEHENVKNPENDPKKNSVSTTIEGGLKAGETKVVPLTLLPRRPGALTVNVRAVGGGLQAGADWVVNVEQPKITLRVDGPAKRYVGRTAEWKIIVKNEGLAEQAGVVVRDRLPPELVYKSSSRGGSYAAGEVTWSLGTIRPGEEIVLDLATDAVKANPAAEKVTQLTGDGNVRVDKVSRIAIEGAPGIKMVMNHETNPVEVGKPVVYRMTLTNNGSAPAKNIDVKATVVTGDLLKAAKGNGPTKGTIQGNIVTFERVESLAPGATVTFLIECQALKEGDARFRVEYTSELNQEPIREEEATRILAPLTNPIPAQPLPKKE
jgi:uncharacterized repeat protein (TIGR01451 family)